MTRPLRQVADRPVRPADHQPHRPGWICTQCGADWPCAPYRDHLLETLDRGAIASLMASWHPQMLAELGEEAAVHARLHAWHRHEGWRPVGGPL